MRDIVGLKRHLRGNYKPTVLPILAIFESMDHGLDEIYRIAELRMGSKSSDQGYA